MKPMLKKLSLLLFLAVFISSCDFARESTVWQRGTHYFEYTGWGPLAHKPVIVRYHIPAEGNIRNMPVLFVIPGAQRYSGLALESWTDFAERDGFVVIAPEFPRDIWDVNAYQLGNVFTDNTFTELNPREMWAYNIIEAVFDFFKEETGNRSEKYYLNGHSAGGQFAHRMVLAMPDARIRFTVAANPSSWTHAFVDGVKDQNGNVFGWPFSVKGTPFADEENIIRYLAAPMVIHLGTNDTSTTAHDLDRSIGAQATGSNRYCRGIAFFDAMQQLAEEMGVPFNWQRVDVEGIAHSGRGMIYGKRKTEEEDRNAGFCIDYITTTGAYYLIFGSR
ncbi:MAG: hypothetical protein FWC94_05310 [Bacteroidales bacterium]|nr:hypothetical protein [Bacteroidales bacterium]